MNEKDNLRRKKKAWIDKLYYDVGKQQYDFFLCGTYEKNGEKLFSKWKKFSECIFPIDENGTCDDYKVQKFFDQISHRQILPIEIILDAEDPNQLEGSKKELIKLKVPFEIWTAGKGYHFRIIFDKEVSEENKLFYLKKFDVDIQKASKKTMIALEHVPHWKSGKIKERIWKQN